MSAVAASDDAARAALLYDTEASLRLVDTELRALDAAPGAPPGAHPLGLNALPLVLERANAEIQGVLANLRETRAALETSTVEKLQHTSSKLREVTSATEVAATDILDALDRAQGMVDELEAAEAEDDRARTGAARDRIRDEIFGMMGTLQFQDITTQQLAYAASVLSEMEARLLQIARLFDPAAALGRRALLGAPDPRTFEPRATTQGAEARQALVDLADAHGVALDERRAARAVAAGRGDALKRRLTGM